MLKLFFRAISIWLLFAIIAPINGLVREFLIIPGLEEWIPVFAGMTEKIGYAISSFSLALIIGIIIYFTFSWLRIVSRREAWMVGGLWVILTMLFEFGLGRAMGVAWSVMFADYNIFAGRLWLLVLATELIAPVMLVKNRMNNK